MDVIVPAHLPIAEHTPEGAVQLHVSSGSVPYGSAIEAMESRVAAIRAGTAPECVWFLEHPPLYTAGTSAKDTDLIQPERFPVHRTGRGGQFTYHGPGQRVVYVMLNLQGLKACGGGPDVRCFVHHLEEWLIQALARLGVSGERREGRIGIWVARGAHEAKIAAIGVRVRHWVSYHGVALNVAPDLTHFSGIVPCGVAGHGVTSLQDLGRTATMAATDAALMAAFEEVFGVPLHAEPPD